jgi:hypothetical protein
MIAGNALSPRELLRLDDFALSVLVESIAHATHMDETAKDLATRIESRDLFKQVPVESDRLNWFLRQEHARERLYEAIRPYCPGNPDYYLIIDETEFNMMSHEDDQRVCLVNADGSADYAVEHPAFEHYRRARSVGLRLFTVREAVRVAASCIGS